VFDEAMNGSEEVLSCFVLDYPIKTQAGTPTLFSERISWRKEFPDVKLSIIGFEAIVDDDAKAMVHHFIVRVLLITNNGQSQIVKVTLGG
jgi:hypothetical protein